MDVELSDLSESLLNEEIEETKKTDNQCKKIHHISDFIISNYFEIRPTS